MNQNRSICLIQPQYSFNKYLFDFTLYGLYEHLGLEYLQSSLEKSGYVVKNLEGPSLEMTQEDILEQVTETTPKLVGVTVDNHSLEVSMNLAFEIKKRLKNAHITVGGHLATCAAMEIMNDFECVDSIVLGYGEKTIVEMAERLCNGLPLDDVVGIIFRKGSQILQNPLRKQLLDIDEIPFPARSVLRYRQSQNYPPSARMITSRGCPFNCAYCTTPAFLSSQVCDRWMARSPKNIVNEISELINSFGIRVIIFCDDNFIGPYEYGRKRAREIARLIVESGLSVYFWIMCRVDSFPDGDDDFVRLLKKAGLWGVFLGVESGVVSQLEAYGKSINVTKNEPTVNLFKEHNIMVELGFIMFHPYVTFNELRANAEFLYRVRESGIFKYFANRLELYPKIGFIEDLRQRNLLVNDYRYNLLYGYRFLDHRIRNLAIAMEKIANEIQTMDEIVWNLKRLSQLISLFIDECQNASAMHTLAEKLFQIKSSIDNIECNIGEINYQEFLKYLEIASNRREISEYRPVKNGHKDRLSAEIREFIEPLNNLLRLENKLKRLKDSDLLKWFFESPIYCKLQDYE